MVYKMINFMKKYVVEMILSSQVNSVVFMVDAAGSKSAGSDTVRVRVSPWAHL